MITYAIRVGITAGLATLALAGCASERMTVADGFIARMDAMPPEQRVPNWDEIRGMMVRDAPAIGDLAPDFELEARDGSGTVSLAGFQRNVPVVLIFGSWT